jgi:hypothetical protein
MSNYYLNYFQFITLIGFAIRQITIVLSVKNPSYLRHLCANLFN